MGKGSVATRRITIGRIVRAAVVAMWEFFSVAMLSRVGRRAAAGRQRGFSVAMLSRVGRRAAAGDSLGSVEAFFCCSVVTRRETRASGGQFRQCGSFFLLLCWHASRDARQRSQFTVIVSVFVSMQNIVPSKKSKPIRPSYSE